MKTMNSTKSTVETAKDKAIKAEAAEKLAKQAKDAADEKAMDEAKAKALASSKKAKTAKTVCQANLDAIDALRELAKVNKSITVKQFRTAHYVKISSGKVLDGLTNAVLNNINKACKLFGKNEECRSFTLYSGGTKTLHIKSVK